MTDRDEFDEAFMFQNQQKMRKINRIFHAAFLVCAIPAGIELLFNIILLIGGLVTLGLALFGGVFITIPADIVMLLLFMFSEQKNKRATVFSIFAIIAHGAIYTMSAGMLLLPLAVLQIVMQALCLKQYSKLIELSTYPGYPDFNPIFFTDRWTRRIVSDEQVKITLEENKKGVKMDEIELEDPQGLEIIKPPSIDDIFTDDPNTD